MRHPHVSLHYHFVWSTWDRAPRLTPILERRIHAAILARCEALGVVPIAVGGTDDHIHLLVGAPATLAPAEIMKNVKGATSHLINHAFGLAELFRWQGAYGVFAVSAERVLLVERYVLQQRARHANGDLAPDWERTSCEPPPGSGEA